MLTFSFPSFADKSQFLDKSGDIAVNKQAPSFGGLTVEDKVFSLKKSFDDGSKLVVLSFFATWCIPCRTGIKQLNDNKVKLSKNYIKVVLVNLTYSDEKEDEKLESFMKDEKIVFNVIKDKSGEIAKKYGVAGSSLPRTFLIGKNFNIKKIIGSEGDDFINIIVESSK